MLEDDTSTVLYRFTTSKLGNHGTKGKERGDHPIEPYPASRRKREVRVDDFSKIIASTRFFNGWKKCLMMNFLKLRKLVSSNCFNSSKLDPFRVENVLATRPKRLLICPFEK